MLLECLACDQVGVATVSFLDGMCPECGCGWPQVVPVSHPASSLDYLINDLKAWEMARPN
jgi:hypothetical protein